MKTYINSSQFTVHSSRLNQKPETRNPKLRIWVAAAFLLLPLTLFALTPTPFFMDFYGSIAGAKAGDEVTVHSGKGIICGKFTITKEGEYGFLHVYGDDKATDTVEGAIPNEPLTFMLNGAPLQSNNPVVWLGDGQKQRVDFRR